MEKASFTLVHNRHKRLNADGTAPVVLRAYYNYESKFFATGVKLTPAQWDKKRQRAKGSTPTILKINKQLNSLVSVCQNLELDRLNAGKTFTLEVLAEHLNGTSKTDEKSFTAFIKYEIDNDRISEPATIVNFTTTYKAFKEFRKDVLFEELTLELLQKFQNYLIDRGLKRNTINKYFRHIRKFTNTAIDKGLFDLNRYPFRKFTAPTEETAPKFLTPEELAKIETVEFTDEKAHLYKVRDMFLFATYTGLRFSDICTLSRDDFQTIDGDLWLIKQMIKTGEWVRLPLHLLFKGNATDILSKYQQADKKYIFDEFTNQYVNRALKEVGTLAGLEKKLTFHVARHTQATLLLYKGVPQTTVQKILGHKKIASTAVYSRVMDMTIVNDLQAAKF